MSLGSVARVRLLLLGVAVVAFGAAGCTPAAAGPTNSPATGGTITLYTSVTQDTVDAVLAALAQAYPDLHVNVFRAPTGQLDARIAAEQRSGGVQADVLWATDPLSTEAYSAQGLLAPLAGPGEDLSAVPSQYRTDTFVGTRLLNLVMVSGSDVQPQPVSWHDLTSAAYQDAVALPDPAFAGSAFAALAYFASTPDFGIDFYRQLKANGAVQVQAIGDVITNVANGTQKVGISLDKSVRDEVDKGSPIESRVASAGRHRGLQPGGDLHLEQPSRRGRDTGRFPGVGARADRDRGHRLAAHSRRRPVEQVGTGGRRRLGPGVRRTAAAARPVPRHLRPVI